MSQGTLDLEFPGPEGVYYKFHDYFGKTVRCTIPVEFYSDEWHNGMRAQVYLGQICSHHAGGVCLQPPDRAQGVSRELGQCIPLTGKERLEILPGLLHEYA